MCQSAIKEPNPPSTTRNFSLFIKICYVIGGAKKNGVPPSAPLFRAVAVTYCNGFSFLFRAVAGRDEKAPFGLKCAKQCQSVGSFTPKIGRSPMLCKTLKKGSLRLRIRMPRKTTYPSYLYRRGQLFSFRYVIPERYRKQGKTELHLSPQTPYLSRPGSYGCSKRPLRW